MRILLFNLRDIQNPAAGGAELFTHEVAKRWASFGNQVTLIASNYRGGASAEVVDGVEIIRLGNAVTVQWRAQTYYKNHKDRYDFIIDIYTLRPFLTPRFVTKSKLFFVHELARKKYFCELPPIVSHFFYYIVEPRWLSYYRDVDIATVSNSTKDAVRKFGITKIRIVSEGVSNDPLSQVPEKEEVTTLLFVGLLKKSNRVEHVLEAFEMMADKLDKAQLWIAGRGPQLKGLKKRAKGLNVTFFGHVSEEKKLDLMRRAHVLLVPAVHEGWGLVVTEANACGTPAIGYDVGGLRESIRDGETGLLTKSNPIALSKAALRFFADENLQERLTQNCLEWSRQFSWDLTAKEIMAVIRDVIKQDESGRVA